MLLLLQQNIHRLLQHLRQLPLLLLLLQLLTHHYQKLLRLQRQRLIHSQTLLLRLLQLLLLLRLLLTHLLLLRLLTHLLLLLRLHYH